MGWRLVAQRWNIKNKIGKQKPGKHTSAKPWGQGKTRVGRTEKGQGETGTVEWRELGKQHTAELNQRR